MAHIDHFAYGWITPTLSYALSVLGSFLGLICAGRARSAPSAGQRTWWLVLAAVAIGGTAIWTMHFIAMLGFGVTNATIRYDVGLTAASAVIAIVAVAIGLLLVTGGRSAAVRVLTGGLVTGLGVAAMHYTGMAAMRLGGVIDYDPVRVTLSVLIAVVAATVALWLAITVQRVLAVFASALVMGLAVNGMHFTGMTAMSVRLEPGGGPVSGATVGTLLVPIVLAVIFVAVGLAYALMAAPTEEDRAGLAYLAARQADRAGAPAGAADRAEPGVGRGGSPADPVGLRGRSSFTPLERRRPDAGGR